MALCVIILLVVTVAISSRIISGGFQEVENQKVQENLERLRDTYELNLENLSTKLADWSAWDDTYKFVEDGNREYIQSNLVAGTLTNLKIDVMVFTNREASVAASLGEVPLSLQALLVKDNPLVRHVEVQSEKRGLLMTEDGPLLFASRPIVTSADMGPIRGSVIFGQFLDAQAIRELSGVIHLPLEVIEIDHGVAPQWQGVVSEIQTSDQGVVRVVDRNTIDGFMIIKDWEGKPALLVRVSESRDIANQGLISMSFFTAAFVAMGILFLIALAIFLHRFLIGRIEFLSGEVRRVGESGSLEVRIPPSIGEDEISYLAASVNEMLNKLHRSQLELLSEKAKVKSFFDIVSGIVVVVGKGGNVLDMNKKGAEVLGTSAEKAIGRNWFDTFVPERVRSENKRVFWEIAQQGKLEEYKFVESPVVASGGVEKLFGWYNSVVKDDKGEIIAVVSHGEELPVK